MAAGVRVGFVDSQSKFRRIANTTELDRKRRIFK
jgi:hypothetical protein